MSLPDFTFEMAWTTEQKVFIVEAYFRQKSIHSAQWQFKGSKNGSKNGFSVVMSREL